MKLKQRFPKVTTPAYSSINLFNGIGKHASGPVKILTVVEIRLLIFIKREDINRVESKLFERVD